MSESQVQENKNENKQQQQPLDKETNESNNNQVNINIIQLPVQQPKHTIQDDIVEFNDSIQKKRNSQRKSVFSNHEDQNLSELIQNHNQSPKKQDNHLSNNVLLVPNNNLNENIDNNSNEQNNQSSNNQNSSLPQRPSHTAQDDIKELTESIEQRKSIRRASKFGMPSLNQLHQNNAQEEENKNNNDKDEKQQNNNDNGEKSDDDNDSEQNDENNIISLNNLEVKQIKPQSSHQLVQTEDHDGEQQKSIKELEEEAKKKPNNLNEIIKLNTEINQKKELKRKSTFSVPIIEDDDEEDKNNKKSQKDIQQTEEIKEVTVQEENDEQIKKKPNAYNEIMKLNDDIKQKRDVKRKSTFSIPVIPDDNENDKSKDEKEQQIPIKKEEDKIQEEPIQEENEETPQAKKESSPKQDLPVQQKSTVQFEIQELNNKILSKRQLSRKSTFSVAQKHNDEDEEEVDDAKSETSIQKNTNEDGNQEGNNPKKPNAYNDIVKLNSEIQSKKKFERKSTFSQRNVKEEQDEDEDKQEENNNKNEQVIEGNQVDENGVVIQKKPNAYNEIISLNNQIQTKKSLNRKSTFCIPVKDEDSEEDKEEGNKEENNQIKESDNVNSDNVEQNKKKPNAFNEIIELNNQIHQKNDIKRKSTFSIPVIEDLDDEHEQKQKISPRKQAEEQIDEEDIENETEEARFIRQKKKKNLMDYKEEQEEKQKQVNDKKMIFKEQNKANYRKVIHQQDKNQKQEIIQKQEIELEVQQEEENVVEQKSNEQKEDEQQAVLAKSAEPSFRGDAAADVKNSFSAEKPLIKVKKPVISERRNEFALQRKLEYLTAQSAKNELPRKEKDRIPHNKFIAQELSKEVRIKEANKRKRELEQMLAQINREIQFIRVSDPDYESLAQNNLHIKSLQEDKNQQKNQAHGGNDPQFGGSSIHSNSEKRNLNKVILPAIKKNNQIKEMIKIAEDQQAKQEALSLVQKMKREKEIKRQKKDEEFNQVNDQILKEVEMRRNQNENLHEKIMLEKRQKLLHKKQIYESKKEEQQKLLVASKNFLKDLRHIGPSKPSAASAYQNQLNQIDSEHKFGQYQTPELDAHKIGLQEIRNLAKGEYSGGGSLPRFMQAKEKDNSDYQKLLEENQINRDGEAKITENRKQLYNKRMEYSKSVKNNLFSRGKKDLGQNILFQDDKIGKNSSQVSNYSSSQDLKIQKPIKGYQANQKQNLVDKGEDTLDYQQDNLKQYQSQQQNEQSEFFSKNLNNNDNNNNNNVKMWRVKQIQK